MRKITKAIIGVLVGLTLTCGYVYADAVTLNWSAATQNTDGSAIVDLASFNVYARSDTNFVKGADIVANVTPVNASPSVGEAYNAALDVPVNTWVTVTSVDSSNNESGFAAPVLYVDGAVLDIPLPPTQLILTKP